MKYNELNKNNTKVNYQISGNVELCYNCNDTENWKNIKHFTIKEYDTTKTIENKINAIISKLNKFVIYFDYDYKLVMVYTF